MIYGDTMRRLFGSLVLTASLAACGDDLPDPPPAGVDSTSSTGTLDTTTTGDDPTTTSTTTTGVDDTAGDSTTTHGGGTLGELDDCQTTSDCDPGLLCVAPFDESLGPEGKGLNECVAECVGIMDETRWCADAQACCDPEAECTDRGYCVLPGESTGSDTGGSDTGTTTGG